MSAVVLDFSKAKPLPQSGVALDFSKAKPIGGDASRPAGLPDGVSLPGLPSAPRIDMNPVDASTLGTLDANLDKGTQGKQPGDGLIMGALKDFGAGGGDIERSLAHPLDTIRSMASTPDSGLAGLASMMGDDTAVNTLRAAKLTSVPRLLGQIGTGSILGELGSEAGLTALNKIPSATRAGANFESLTNQLASEPVSLNETLKPLQRATEIGARGSQLPKAVSDLLTRSQSPIDMTFPEARDYQSSLSDLSASDKMALNGRMKGSVSQLNKALFNDLKNAADAKGLGEDYASAMKEYRQAKQLQTIKTNVGKYAVRGAAGLAGVEGLHRLLGTISSK